MDEAKLRTDNSPLKKWQSSGLIQPCIKIYNDRQFTTSLSHKTLTPNSKMTRLLLTSCLLMILTSCGRTNLLTYKHKRYYREESIILSDTTFTLYQKVCYNRPRVIDEEFCHSISLIFIDTAAAKAKRILDLQTDTAIVKAGYGILSVWNWSDENNKVFGHIEVLKWDSNEVRLKENIQTIDLRRKRTQKLVGTRTFKRKDGW